MEEFLLQHQGLIEDLAGITLVLAVAWLYLFVWPVFKTGWNDDPLKGIDFRN